MARTPLTTPAAGNTNWRGWADQLGTEHESLFSATSGSIDTATQGNVRTNIGAQKALKYNPTEAEIAVMETGDLYVTGTPGSPLTVQRKEDAIVTVGATTYGVPSGTTLTPSGPLTVSTNGATIDALDISGDLVIDANDVTVKRCRVRGSAYYVIKVMEGRTGVSIQDVEVDGLGASGMDGSAGILGGDQVIRANIYGVENGILPFSGATITGCYIHDLAAPGEPHFDGIQSDGGGTNILIDKCTIDMSGLGQTSPINVNNYWGTTDGFVVQYCILRGGGYTLTIDGDFQTQPMTNITVTGNRLESGQWGYVLSRNAGVTWTDNVDFTSGSAVAG